MHFANNHIAYKQLDELLESINRRHSKPIVLGDYNIYKLAEYKHQSQLLQAYQLSSEVAQYVSYEADGESLDYIAVSKDQYNLSNVICSDTYVSDHKALVANVSRSN